MIHLKNFIQYEPSSAEKKELAANFCAMFFRAETGEDWYDTLPEFQDETFKVKYSQDGVIVSFAQDASVLCPIGGNIIEVSSIPDELEANGSWVFVDGEFKRREKTKDELIAQAETKKISLLSGVSHITKPLEDAVDLDMATQEEIKKLKAWKIYRVKLNRVDVTLAPDIEWPLAPNENQAQ